MCNTHVRRLVLHSHNRGNTNLHEVRGEAEFHIDDQPHLFPEGLSHILDLDPSAIVHVQPGEASASRHAANVVVSKLADVLVCQELERSSLWTPKSLASLKYGKPTNCGGTAPCARVGVLTDREQAHDCLLPVHGAV